MVTPEAHDALLPHLAATLAMDWCSPPPRVARRLALLDDQRLQHRLEQERYLREWDLPSHEGESQRESGFLEGLKATRSLAEAAKPLNRNTRESDSRSKPRPALPA